MMKISYVRTLSNITLELTPLQVACIVEILRTRVAAQLISELNLDSLISTESELYSLLPEVNLEVHPTSGSTYRPKREKEC